MNEQKRVLIAPLDWGLGHASRCMPVIDALVRNNYEVIVAADGNSYFFLKKEYPDLKFIKMKGYRVFYSSKLGMTLSILIQIPKIINAVIREHNQLKRFVKKHVIDLIISDNRYGFWSKHVPGIFITHQLMVKMPGHLKILEGILHRIIKLFINKYNQCWIPDVEGDDNLSGDLSHRYPLSENSFFIGPLSRFKPELNSTGGKFKDIDLLIVLSGPEPHRGMFEKILINQLHDIPYKTLLVRGLAGMYEFRKISNTVSTVSYLNAKELNRLILMAKWVVCRSGYSSVMDLVRLQKKAVLVPTPGQTEQEYLARYLKERGYFYSVAQKHFILEDAIDNIPEFYPATNIRFADMKTLMGTL